MQGGGRRGGGGERKRRGGGGGRKGGGEGGRGGGGEGGGGRGGRRGGGGGRGEGGGGGGGGGGIEGEGGVRADVVGYRRHGLSGVGERSAIDGVGQHRLFDQDRAVFPLDASRKNFVVQLVQFTEKLRRLLDAYGGTGNRPDDRRVAANPYAADGGAAAVGVVAGAVAPQVPDSPTSPAGNARRASGPGRCPTSWIPPPRTRRRIRLKRIEPTPHVVNEKRRRRSQI